MTVRGFGEEGLHFNPLWKRSLVVALLKTNQISSLNLIGSDVMFTRNAKTVMVELFSIDTNYKQWT